MYILVKKKDVSNEEILNMYHETMPDGRLILPISDLRMLGSIPNCQIVASAKELKENFVVTKYLICAIWIACLQVFNIVIVVQLT